MLNLSALNAIYGNDIPTELQDALKSLEEVLDKQKSLVKEVTVLPNCSIDQDRTIHLQKHLSQDIKYVLQGLVVRVSPQYKLSYADAIWFHPEIGKGRSVYNGTLEKEQLNIVKEVDVQSAYPKENPIIMSPFQCDVGHYTNTSVDEMGLSSTENKVIVNVSLESLTFPLWSRYLMTNENMNNVYEHWHNLDVGNGRTVSETCAHVRNQIASKLCGNNTPVYKDQINALYYDGQSIFYANHAVKTPDQEEANVLLHCSALSGYEMFHTKTNELFLPSNLGLSSHNFKWDDMSENQQKRIFKDCAWEGNEGFNTYVLKPPALTSAQKKEFEQRYKLFNCNRIVMKCAKFSSQPVRDLMKVSKLLELTPLKVEDKTKRHGENVELKMALEYKPFEKLINNFEKISKVYPNFHLFNKDLVKDGYIKIPREIVKELSI